MAVFWFGWTKKLKNIFTKQQADQHYLQKELPNQLQIVKGNVDFYKSVVIKQNGYVDHVDTNAPTSMINKRYVDSKISAPTLLGTLTLNNQNPNNRSITITRFNYNYPLYFEVCLNHSGLSAPHNQIFFCSTITPHNTNSTYKLLDERYLDVYPGGSWSGSLVLFVEVNSLTALKFLSIDSQTAYQYIKIYGTPQ